MKNHFLSLSPLKQQFVLIIHDDRVQVNITIIDPENIRKLPTIPLCS
jgi:hypothetical protein